MPRRKKKKFAMPADRSYHAFHGGDKWVSYSPAQTIGDESYPEYGHIDKGSINVYDYGDTEKSKRVTRKPDDTYELRKRSKRGTKTKEISKVRGERFLKRTAKKAIKHDTDKGEARAEKKTMRIMERGAKKRSRNVKRINRRNK